MLAEILELLQNSPFYQGTILIFVALLLTKFTPLPKPLQPFYWYQLLALGLSAKVNHPDRDTSQQTTAGLMSVILMVLPFWFVIIFISQLAASPWFFEILILYCCLSDDSFIKESKHYAAALKSEKKASVRRLLQPWTNRCTQNLSEVGLTKTIIEKLYTVPIYGLVGTLILFSFGGIALVLIARMIRQLQISWPPLNPEYANFGKPAYYLNYWLYLLPMVLWNFSLAIQGGSNTLKRMLGPTLTKVPVNHLLSSYEIAAHLQKIELGGPVQYSHSKTKEISKVSRPKVGYPHDPSTTQLIQAITLSSSTYLIWVMLLLLFPTVWTFLYFLNN